MTLKAILLRQTWSHMASVSGFDPLCAAIKSKIGASQVVDLMSTGGIYKANIARRLIAKLRSRISKRKICPHPGIFATIENQILAKKAVDLARKHSNATIFLASGENQYAGFFREAPESVRKRIVLCLHQPPSYLKLHWKDFHAFDGLKSIVCLSPQQKDYLEPLTSTPIRTILHGVSADFFTPCANPIPKGNRVLFVGQWLRDFQLLYQTIENLRNSNTSFFLDCVVSQSTRHLDPILRLSKYLNVFFYSDLSPEQLREMYWKATVLFQPLIDATANNAVVEAMSCGVPVVATDVGGLSQYIDQTRGILCKDGDASDHAKGVRRYLDEGQMASVAGRRAREFAQKFLNWNSISQDLMDLFPGQ
jgi:glycosyltransferase involved in cell wall biosynthesis